MVEFTVGHIQENNKILTMNATETKLVSLLDQKNVYPPMVRNAIDLLLKDFITRIEKTVEEYETECKPIIEDQLRIPALVQQKSVQLIKDGHGAHSGNILTPTVYSYEINRITESLLRESGNCSLDSDDRGDTEDEVENIVRLNPKVLNRLDFHGLGCRSVRSLLFLPLIMKLQKEFGYLHEHTLLLMV